MIVISGYAQCTLENNHKYEKGNKHKIGLFTQDKNYNKNMPEIEKFINKLGWNSIVFLHVEKINEITDIQHQTLIQGIDKATKNGQSLIVDNTPIYFH
jgi:hypothetical protein